MGQRKRKKKKDYASSRLGSNKRCEYTFVTQAEEESISI